MSRIIGISGSLRKGSYNSALLHAAAALQIPDLHIEICSIKGIPLYDGDVEVGDGLPAVVVQLKEKIAAADGLLLVTPEYNNSIPGVFKNAIDWLSRPASDIPRIFGQRPVALIGASPGGFGTVLSQNAWLQVLRTLGTRAYFAGPLYVSAAYKVFNEQGELTDTGVQDRLLHFLQGFRNFIG
jgi:chromate reductase